MNSNAAVVLPFPSAEQTARELEDKVLTDYLRAKRDEADAQRRIERFKPRATEILEARREGFAAAGLGSLSVLDVAAGETPDMKAIEAFFAAHGATIPMKKKNGGGPQLRASLLK